MANNRPIEEVQVLSARKSAWLKQTIGGVWGDMTKHTALVAVMIGIKNPHRPTETLHDEALRADKLHDGHPELIVTTVEQRFGNIFDNLLGDVPPDLTKKKAFISEFITCQLKLGMRRYGKPNLRKKAHLESVLDLDGLQMGN